MVYAGTSDRALMVRHGEGKGQYTVLACVNAAGESQPLLFVFKGTYFSRELSAFDVALDEKTGWMTAKVFAQWFRKFTDAVKERPLLLLLDGHLSHVSAEVIEMAMQKDSRQLSITILKLPPHATDTLQPLDVGVFGVVKGYWNEDIIEFRRNNIAAGPLTKLNFCQLLTKTWDKITPQIIQKSFSRAGVYPVDFSKYPEHRLDPVLMEKWRRLQQKGVDLNDLEEEEYRKLVCEPLSPKKKSPRKDPPTTPSDNRLPTEPTTSIQHCCIHPAKPTAPPISTSTPPTNDRMWKLEWKLEWVPRWIPADGAALCQNTQPGPSDQLSTPSAIDVSVPSTPALTPEERMQVFHQKVLESRLPAKIPIRKPAEVITNPKFLQKRKEIEERSRARAKSKTSKVCKRSRCDTPELATKKSLKRTRTPSPASSSNSENSTTTRQPPALSEYQSDPEESSVSDEGPQREVMSFRYQRSLVRKSMNSAVRSLDTHPKDPPMPKFPCEIFYAVYFDDQPYLGKIIAFEPTLQMKFLQRDLQLSDTDRLIFHWPKKDDIERNVQLNQLIDGPVALLPKQTTDSRGSDRCRKAYILDVDTYKKLVDLNSRYRAYICSPSPHPSEDENELAVSSQ